MKCRTLMSGFSLPIKRWEIKTILQKTRKKSALTCSVYPMSRLWDEEKLSFFLFNTRTHIPHVLKPCSERICKILILNYCKHYFVISSNFAKMLLVHNIYPITKNINARGRTVCFRQKFIHFTNFLNNRMI